MRIPVCLSVVFCLACALRAQRPAAFNDPQGRFAMQAPAGWKATPLNSDAVQLANGAAYLTVMVLPGGDAGILLDAIARQTGGQWKGFREAHRGATRLAGRSGQFVTYQGTNPAGADAYLEMMAVSEQGSTYLIMISAPAAEFGRFQGAFDQIEKSFTLSSRTNPVPPPPVPAGAPAKAPPPVPPTPSTAPGNPGYYRMKKVTIVDEHGFEQPLQALSLLIPADWQFQGTAQYAKAAGCHANLVQVTFRATSPDGKLALELFPGNTWQWADDAGAVRLMQSSNRQLAQFGYQGCDIMPPLAAGEFLKRTVLPAMRREARVAAMEPMPEIAREVERQVQQAQAAAAQRGIQVRIRGDAGRARLAYDLDGQAMEEWVTAVTYASAVTGPTFNMGRMGQTAFYTCAAEGVFGLRAPQGQLEAREKLFLMILSTIRVDPEWHGRVMQAIANLQATDAKGAADRSKIISQSGKDIADIIHQTYENKKQSDDRVAQGFSQYIRGVETYRNPATGDTVDLSNQYGHVWAGNNGEYILSDSANFDPNVALRGNWTRLEQVKR